MSGAVALVRQVVRGELAQHAGTLLGVVTATYPHAGSGDDENLEVDVRLKHEDLELRHVPVAVPCVGFAAPPRVGELVVVSLVGGALNEPLVTSRLYHADERAPLAQENELLLEHRVPDGTLNHLRFQADGTMLLQRDVTKPRDGSEAKTTISVDGSSGDITIRMDKDVVVKVGHDKSLTITCSGQPVTVKCKTMTVDGDVAVNGDLTVSKPGGKTTISGNKITGGV
jgi:phage baseplate assembly protein gpV